MLPKYYHNYSVGCEQIPIYRVLRKDHRKNSSLVYLVSHLFAEVAGGTSMEDQLEGSR